MCDAAYDGVAYGEFVPMMCVSRVWHMRLRCISRWPKKTLEPHGEGDS